MPSPRLIRLILLAALIAGASGCGDATSTSSSSDATADTQRIAALRAQLASLQDKVRREQDAKAIKRLQRAFGYYMEQALWDQVADLFADNATFEWGRDGVYQGKARIKQYLYAMNDGRQGLDEGQLNEFLQLMPVVTLGEDGVTARSRWRNIMMLGKLGEQGLWGEGPYENEYVKEDGVWKFSRLRWHQTILVPYKGAWGHSEDVNKGIWVSGKLPPDAPPTSDDPIWPTTYLPPFSFTNPVGKYMPAQAQGGEQ